MKRFIIILMSVLCFFASFGTVAQAASDNLTPNNNGSKSNHVGKTFY